jgi:hypothetical protein
MHEVSSGNGVGRRRGPDGESDFSKGKDKDRAKTEQLRSACQVNICHAKKYVIQLCVRV